MPDNDEEIGNKVAFFLHAAESLGWKTIAIPQYENLDGSLRWVIIGAAEEVEKAIRQFPDLTFNLYEAPEPH